MTRRWGAARSALLLAALLPAACMRTFEFDPPGGGGGTSGGDAGPGGGGNGVDGGNSDGSHLHCTGGASPTSLTVEQEVPSIMFVLDRSPSMLKNVAPTSSSRFLVAGSAITDTVHNYSQVAQFGYVEFPGLPSGDNSCPQSGCCAGGTVPVAPTGSSGGIVSAISMRLMACTNNSQNNCAFTDATPTGQALKKVVNAITGKWLYAVLLTDGGPSPNCVLSSSSPDVCVETQQQISSMSNESSPTPISTFVVGVGDSISPNDEDCLGGMATAGGHSTGTAPFYIVANTEALVRSQVDAIVASTICNVDVIDSFDTSRPIEVDFNNAAIPNDPTKTNGWDLDRNKSRITFYGPACTTLIQELKTTPKRVVVKACVDPSHAFQQPAP